MKDKEATTPSPSSGSGTRTVVLLGILAVLLAAFAYDYLYAAPRAKKIHDEIYAFCDDSAKKPDADNKPNVPKLYTPADIHKMLGEKLGGGNEMLPSKVTVVMPGHLVETYSVMAGAIVRTHDVHVVYTANNPETAKDGKSVANFSTVQQGEFPKGDIVPQAKPAGPPTPLPGPPSPSGGGGGPPGGRRPGGGGASATVGETKEEPKKEEPKKEEGKEAEKKEGEAKEAAPGESKAEEKKPEEKKEEPKPEEPKKEEPKPEEPKKEEPKKEEPKKEEPKKEEPKKEEPKKEEPKKEEPKAEEPKKEEPKPEEKPGAPTP